MQVHQLRSPEGSRKRKKIVGRGKGTGHGKRSGRGQTGQNCRSGRGVMLAYEGGQMSLLRRLPKVGFNSKWPANSRRVIRIFIYHLITINWNSQREERTSIK